MKNINYENKDLLEVIELFGDLKKENTELYNKLRIFLEINNAIKKTEII